MTEQPLKYEDFNLRFFAYDEAKHTFKVCVEGSTLGGSMKFDHAVEQFYDSAQYWNVSAGATSNLLSMLEIRRITKNDLYELGHRLANLALPEGKVRTIFQQSLSKLSNGRGLRLRLRIDPVALVHLPWEYMLLSQASGGETDTDFLALRDNVSIVRTDTVEGPAPQFGPLSTVRIAGVLSNPQSSDKVLPSINVEKDKEAIDRAVTELRKNFKKKVIDKIRWATRPATIDALRTVLKDEVDIFYYAGHAMFDPDTQDGGKILLEKESDGADGIAYFDGQDLMQLLRDAKVRLVILNACETGRRNGQNVWSGIAPCLTREHIPAVIANQYNIEDEHARLLTERLYEYLLYGCTVDEALYQARKAIHLESREANKRDWGVPVLYLRDPVIAELFPPQQWKVAEDYYSQAESCHNEMLQVQKQLAQSCEPLMFANSIETYQLDEIDKNIEGLSNLVAQFRNLLKKFDLPMLLSADGVSPLQQYQLIVALDGLEGGVEKLERHVAGNDQAVQPKIAEWVHEDLVAIQQAVDNLKPAYAYVARLQLRKVRPIT